MPLSRYQIRNEYSLADPELYRAADKDDPEALLEGVAMAGLVGVLRQLGDLAEFAAEVFHNLHEEVIATASRGHNLMSRVQQLEAEFPLIEKTFLSQTNHSSFFYNPGIDWHPNMHMDQASITRGDLPRFVMDSYEECRGPPRLFLLDKFDVAGAGACLKRYTDPSFFKVEPKSQDITEAAQKEKRTRKGKKRGSRLINGDTPEILPTSHAKLHQLLLEERIENNISDPARSVKLKRRLNQFPFDMKKGGSYMEKFSKISSEEREMVREISVRASPLKLLDKSTSESGFDIHEISSESPEKKFRHGSSDMEDKEVYEVSKRDNILSDFDKGDIEKEIVVDREMKTEGYLSDDVLSEVDNYVDALAIMDSELDTDSELKLNNKREMSGFDTNEVDSQSMESSMLSDDGNSSYKKERSTSSFSDTQSISAENIRLEGEVSSILNDVCEDKGIDETVIEQHVDEETENNDGGTKVSERSDHREQTMSNLGQVEGEKEETETSCAQNLPETECIYDISPREYAENEDIDVLDDKYSNGDVNFSSALSEIPWHSRGTASPAKNQDLKSEENLSSLGDNKANMGENSPEDLPVNRFDSEDPIVISGGSDEKLNVSTDTRNSRNISEEDEKSNKSLDSVSRIENAEDDVESKESPEWSFPKIETHNIEPEADDDHIISAPDDVIFLPFTETQSLEGSLHEVDAHDTVLPGTEEESLEKSLVELDKYVTAMESDHRIVLVSDDDDAEIVVVGTKDDNIQPLDSEVSLIVNSFDSSVPELEERSVTESSKDVLSEIIDNIQQPLEAALRSSDDDEFASDTAVMSELDKQVDDQTWSELEEAADVGGEIEGDIKPIMASPDISDLKKLKIDDDSVDPSTLRSSEEGVDPPTDLVEKDTTNFMNVNAERDEAGTSPTGVTLSDLNKLDEESVLKSAEFNEIQMEAEVSVVELGIPKVSFSPPLTSDVSETLHHDHTEPEAEAVGNKGESGHDYIEDEIELNGDKGEHGILQNAGEVSLESLPQLKEKESYDVSDEQGLFYNTSSESLLISHGSQLSGSSSIGEIGEPKNPFLLLPEESEMPPLPPLPPVQWRMGKQQHSSSSSAFPSFSFFKPHQEAQPQLLNPFTAQNSYNLVSNDPLLGQVVLPMEDYHESNTNNLPFLDQTLLLSHVGENDTVQPSLSSFSQGTSSVELDAASSLPSLTTFPSLSLSEPPHQDPFLPRAENSLIEQIPQIDQHESSTNSLPPLGETPLEKLDVKENDTVLLQPSSVSSSNHVSTLSHIEASQTQLEHQVKPETSSKEEKLVDEDNHVIPTKIDKEQPLIVMPLPPSLMGDITWPSQDDNGKANGGHTIKLPRPRNPLIDDVVAHDQSKLRKVAERPRPPIQKDDERDTMLEQIRAKSFNLKPAVVSRPAIQGPTTNLRVAAILEKAKTIRMAFAGSDEDDEDSWSDS